LRSLGTAASDISRVLSEASQKLNKVSIEIETIETRKILLSLQTTVRVIQATIQGVSAFSIEDFVTGVASTVAILSAAVAGLEIAIGGLEGQVLGLQGEDAYVDAMLLFGEKMREFVRNELERPGRTDRFSNLDKELYIGATDQDTSEHVIFGDTGWDDVRISDAVRASTALVPIYAPAWLRGRWFVDGSYTRTSELDVAVEKGATLVVIVDPLVPIRSGVSGYVRRKGGLFAGIQGLKAIVHTRFAEGLRRALERYPNVDFLVVVPEEDDMRLMSGSPMRYNYRVELEALAYQQTLLRIGESYAQFAGELARHGIEIRRPAEVLAASGRPNGSQPV